MASNPPVPLPPRRHVAVVALALAVALPVVLLLLVLGADGAGAQTAPATPDVSAPSPPTPGDGGTGDDGSATIDIDLGDLGKTEDGEGGASQSVVIIIGLTLLSVAPALLVMLTAFTRIVIVLALTRNALGLVGIPPNQVVVGISLFLAFFVMLPVLSQMNEEALQPLLEGEITAQQAYDRATVPLKEFMLENTRSSDLNLFMSASGAEVPAQKEDVSMAALVPAFVLSELRAAFIIGFVIFVPFLIIDLVVSSTLMSMGMFMLPPVLVSLPFKLLLFVMVDGWALIVKSLLSSFN